MELTRNEFGKANLLMWRTESIFFNQKRRESSEEWNRVRYTTLPYPSEPNLINSSLKGRLPFADSSFDAIYSFHIFEHLTYDHGAFALGELYRVLKPGGICRISTPDLLFYTREYVKQQEEISRNGGGDMQAFRYEWSLLNLIDQAVRQEGGGRMVPVLMAPDMDVDYLKYMNGDSLNFMLNGPNASYSVDHARKPTYFSGQPAPLIHRVKKIGFGFLRKMIMRWSPLPVVELSNERNRWLYDSVSLAGQYKKAGFNEVIVQDYKTSLIEHWDKYDYDRSVLGDYPLEPSLYMEGRK